MTVGVPALANSQGTTFVSTRAVRQYLKVDLSISQHSEWFAFDYVPSDMIRLVEPYR